MGSYPPGKQFCQRAIEVFVNVFFTLMGAKSGALQFPLKKILDRNNKLMEYVNYMLVLCAYSEDLKQYLPLLVITLSIFLWILLLCF